MAAPGTPMWDVLYEELNWRSSLEQSRPCQIVLVRHAPAAACHNVMKYQHEATLSLLVLAGWMGGPSQLHLLATAGGAVYCTRWQPRQGLCTM